MTGSAWLRTVKDYICKWHGKQRKEETASQTAHAADMCDCTTNGYSEWCDQHDIASLMFEGQWQVKVIEIDQGWPIMLI